MSYKKSILIIGNGPSTKELVSFGFENIPEHIDTFGMGLAYKYFASIDWWPTYYAYADRKVVKNRESSFRQLIFDERVTVKRFFFPLSLADSPRLEVIPHGSTGDFTFRKAIELGYEQIFIIGIDLDYKPLKEATPITREEFDSLGINVDFHTNVIYRVRSPIKDNPNYFFPGYQEVGDVFSEPRGNSWHLLTWQRARELAEHKKIAVRNVGSSSLLTLFSKTSLSKALQSEQPYVVEFPPIKTSTFAQKIFHAEKSLSDRWLKELGELREKIANSQQPFSYEQSCELTYDENKINKSLLSLGADISRSVKPTYSETIAVSVIVPCFNVANHVYPCLESLAKQTLPQASFEVICVDDCSVDQTMEVLKRFNHRIANLRIVQHLNNRKQGAARNTGINAAQGRYVFFLDADDYLRIDALELMLSLGHASPDLLICQHVKTRFDRPFEPQTSRRCVPETLRSAGLDGSAGWWPVGLLISRQLLDLYEIRFRENVFFEDIDFTIRVYFAADSYFVTKEVLYYYVERDGSTVTSLSEGKIRDAVKAIEVVVEFISGNVTNTEEQRFREKATNWLQLQARRIRDVISCREKKSLLAEYFVKELKASGLLSVLNPELVENVSKSVFSNSSAPKTGISNSYGKFYYTPWSNDFRNEFAGKVVFFCEVDYHIRNVALIARSLKKRGIDSIVIDASNSSSFTANRPLSKFELQFYEDIDVRSFNVAETLPFATDATAFVFANDLTYTKRLIFENFGFGVPTFGLYEGINDDWNLDRVANRMPYRSTDYLLLPGVYQKAFYADRICAIVGLPAVRLRLSLPFVKPTVRRAIINVNFTYGVLEEHRNSFVESAVQACEAIGLEYVITQHPADKGDLSTFKVSLKNVYELIGEGTILISRFSTIILESLASGRPVVYHNPHNECVPKFKRPLGAYSVSHSVESLKDALCRELDFVDNGGDVRERATLFLHFHSNILSEQEPAELAARAIEVFSKKHSRFNFKVKAIEPPEVPMSHLSSESAYRFPAAVRHSSRDIKLLLNQIAAHENDGQMLLISASSYLLTEPDIVLPLIETDSFLWAKIQHAASQSGDNSQVTRNFETAFTLAKGVARKDGLIQCTRAG